MRLAIEALQQAPVADRRVEVVERKGLGHPDTLCDALVEAIAVALNRLYRERACSTSSTSSTAPSSRRAFPIPVRT